MARFTDGGEVRLELVDEARKVRGNGTWLYVATHVNDEKGEGVRSWVGRKAVIADEL